MDVNVVNPSNANPSYNPVRKDGAEGGVVQKSQNAEADVIVKDQKIADTSAAEKQRLDTVLKASKNLANFFAVGDTSITLFKDSAGQYVARFRSLRDGTVHYFPEPVLIQSSPGGQKEALIEVEA